MTAPRAIIRGAIIGAGIAAWAYVLASLRSGDAVVLIVALIVIVAIATRGLQ